MSSSGASGGDIINFHMAYMFSKHMCRSTFKAPPRHMMHVVEHLLVPQEVVSGYQQAAVGFFFPLAGTTLQGTIPTAIHSEYQPSRKF